MEEIINKYVLEHIAASIVIAIGVLLGLGYIIVKITNINNKLKNLPCDDHKDQLKSIPSSFPCESHNSDIILCKNGNSDIKVNMAKIETSIMFMTKSIDSLTQSLQSNKSIIMDPLSQRQSPMRLTTRGEELAQRIGMYEMIYSNWSWINNFIEENAISKNPYDIQQFIQEQITVFPERFISEKNVNTLKLEAYKEGLNLMSFTNVLMIIARDMYFKDHNIELGDIDKHDPNIKG